MSSAALDAAWSKLDAPGGVAWVGAAMALLVAEAEASTSAELAADLLCDAAALASARADGAERAPALYEEAQVRAPGHPRSAEGLALAAEGRGDWLGVARWCEAGLDGGAAGPIRLRLLARLIRAVQDHGASARQPALALVKEALVLAPEDAALQIRRALAGDETADTPEALDSRIAETRSLPHRGRLLLSRAALRREASDIDGARADLVAALEADPSLSAARDCLTQLLVATGDHRSLVDHLEASAAALPDGPMQGRARYVAALYADGPLREPERAKALFEAAAGGLRGDIAAARELARQGVGGVAPLLAWRSDADPGEAALGAWQLGRAAERAGDHALASDAYTQAATGGIRLAGLARRRLMGQGAAAELLDEAVVDDRLAALLADQAAWEALSAGDSAAAAGYFDTVAATLGVARVALGRRKAAAGQAAEGGDALAAWRLGDAEASQQALATAVVEATPAHPAAWLAAAYGQEDPRITLKVADAAPSGMRARLAAWAAHQAGAADEPELEIEAWRLALTDRPSLRLAHINLGRRLAERGAWDDVAALYAQQADDEANRRAALLALGQGRGQGAAGEGLAKSSGGWRWAAVDAAIEQGDLVGAARLLGTSEGAFSAGLAAGLVPSVERARAALAQGQADAGLGWVLEALARPAGDVEGVREALAAQGSAATARARLDGVRVEQPASNAFEAWTAARLAVAAGAFADAEAQLGQLSGQLGATADAWWVAQVAAEVCRWAPEGTDAARVAAAWERVIAVHGDSPRAWDGLLAARSQEPAGRAATLLRAARQSGDERARALQLWEAALLERLRDPELAAELNAQAVEAWPDGALPRLSRWGGWVGDAPSGAPRVAEAVALTGCVRSPALQADLLGQAAEICADTLERPADAARLSAEAALRAPQSWAFVETARGRLRAERAWGPLSAVIEARLAAGPQVAERRELLRALAQIQLEGLRDRAAARTTWQRIVALEPDAAEAHAELADLSFGLEDFPTAASHYELALELGLPEEAAGRLRMRVGRLRARHFKDLDGALRHLRVAEAAGVRGAAEAVAETLLTHGRADEAVAAYAALADQATDPIERSGARAGWVRALIVDGQRDDARSLLKDFRADDPADPLLLALEGELGVPAAERDYRGVLDSVDLPEQEDASDWGESLDLGPLGGLEASASLAFDEDDLALDPGLATAEAPDLGEALAEVDAWLAESASTESRAAGKGTASSGPASEPWALDEPEEPPATVSDSGAPPAGRQLLSDPFAEVPDEGAPGGDAADSGPGEVGLASDPEPAGDPAPQAERSPFDDPAGFEGRVEVGEPAPLVVAAPSEVAEAAPSSQEPDLDPTVEVGAALEAAPTPSAPLEPLEPPRPSQPAVLPSEPDTPPALQLDPEDEPWPERNKRPSTGTLSMGLVAVPRSNQPEALDLDGWDAESELAELALDDSAPAGAMTVVEAQPLQETPASDAPVSMGPDSEEDWPSLPALTPLPSPSQEASGAPLPPAPSPETAPADGVAARAEALEAELAFEDEVAPVAPTTGAIPLVKEPGPAPAVAVPLVAEGKDLEWLEPSVPPAELPATPPPLPAQDSWDELSIEEADSDMNPIDPPMPSVELEWAELDLAPASVEVAAVEAPGPAEDSWSDLDDPFEGDLGDDGQDPPSWPADISGVEPLDLEAEDLGLETPRPLPPPPAVPPAVVRPSPRAKGPSRADRAAEARIRIAREPLAPAGWLMLSEAETGDPAVTAWLSDVLAWLQGRVETPASPGQPSEPVPERLRRAMVPDGVPPNLLLLLRSVGPSVAPAFGPVKGRDRHGRRVPDHEPLAALVRRMSRLLEVPPVHAVLNDARPYTVAAEAGEPSRLVLGTAVFDGADPAGASFLVARTLIPLREGTLPATVLSDREFRAFLAALFDMLDASFPVRSRDQATMERIRGWLDPLLAVHQRLAWEPLAHAAVSGLGSRSAATVRLGLEQYSARLALALADGFGGAMEMLRLLDFDDRPRGQLGRTDLEQFLADNDAARDLLVFAASPACLNARRWMARST